MQCRGEGECPSDRCGRFLRILRTVVFRTTRSLQPSQDKHPILAYAISEEESVGSPSTLSEKKAIGRMLPVSYVEANHWNQSRPSTCSGSLLGRMGTPIRKLRTYTSGCGPKSESHKKALHSSKSPSTAAACAPTASAMSVIPAKIPPVPQRRPTH